MSVFEYLTFGAVCINTVLAMATFVLAREVKHATNSLLDARVLAAGQVSHAAGREEGRAEAEQKAAIRAEGKLEAKES